MIPNVIEDGKERQRCDFCHVACRDWQPVLVDPSEVELLASPLADCFVWPFNENESNEVIERCADDGSGYNSEGLAAAGYRQREWTYMQMGFAWMMPATPLQKAVALH